MSRRGGVESRATGWSADRWRATSSAPLEGSADVNNHTHEQRVELRGNKMQSGESQAGIGVS